MANTYLTVDGGSGSGYHITGSIVAVKAYSWAGFHFVQWYNTVHCTIIGGSGNVSTTIQLNPSYSTASIAAQQNINSYSIHYNAAAGGSIVGSANQTVTYHHDGTLVTAVASGGYHFTGWSDGDSNSSKQAIMVEGDYSATAYFEANAAPTYALTVTNGTGDGNYAAGSDVAIVADAPAPGYVFAQWTGNIAGIADVYDASTTIHTQSSIATISATYALGSFTQPETGYVIWM
jgi:hypothetical protein